MSQSIVASSGHAIIHRTVRSLLTSELHSETEKRKRIVFDDVILKKLGDSVAKSTKTDARENFLYCNVVDPGSIKLPEGNDYFMPDGTTTFEKPIMAQWIHAEMDLPQGDLIQNEKVASRTKDCDVDVTGSCGTNPFPDALTYDVEFSDS